MGLAACGGQANGGGGGGGGGDEFPTAAKATSEDEEGTVFPLAEGRYRLAYRAPSCDEVIINITDATGTEVYNQQPRGYSTFISNLPAGEYTITVTSDCDEWTVDLNKF
ncbi:MAG TPA: hypothetical protein VHQ42_03980 [Candidatus Limnocylindria bacterium]|nr:hypothetical protein [Candidatus Limnocylindria bacterium]